MKKIVVFTGAGISAESGLQTFRDHDGLWMGYNIEEVATPEAFRKNPGLVLQFYNERRKNVLHAEPNLAHTVLADLEGDFDVEVITQNIDDLHERAGSTKVMHLHGEIFKMRSIKNPELIYPIREDILLGDKAEDGEQLRPHIVWFHEEVPNMEWAIRKAMAADIFIIIGTSLMVYPAAGILNYLPEEIPIYVLDRQAPRIKRKSVTYIEQPATEGINRLKDLLLDQK